MADIVDIANELVESEMAERIKNRGSAEIPKGSGECLHCASTLHNPQSRWCDADCRDDWEKAQRAAKNRVTGDE